MEERELLKKILKSIDKLVQNSEPKDSFQITVSDTKTDFRTRFVPHIELKRNKRYEMALLNLETYYSFPNITSGNCRFTYSPDAGTTWVDIIIPEGSYEVEDINDVIQREMKKNNHGETITLSANTNTLKAVLSLKNDYQVDFRPEDSLSSILGFNKVVYTNDYQESENPVNILSINSILVNVDIISGSYVNGGQSPTIYSFFPEVGPGYKIIQSPVKPVFLPIALDRIHSLQTTLTDQDGNPLNLRGEKVTIRFHIREA